MYVEGTFGQPLPSTPITMLYWSAPHRPGMLATVLDWSLQLVGTEPDLQCSGDAVIEAEKVTGQKLLPTTVTPKGANVCPAGQKMGDSCVMK